jgi:hypothetical protein
MLRIGAGRSILTNKDGRREMLSQISDFNFNWHNMYIYDDDVAPLLPKGTILHFVTWYDNTSNNKANPDPNQWVGWGDRTVDADGQRPDQRHPDAHQAVLGRGTVRRRGFEEHGSARP